MKKSEMINIIIQQQNEIDTMNTVLNRQKEIIRSMRLLLMNYVTLEEIAAVEGGETSDS